MKTATEAEFRNWAARNRIGLDDRYPESASLVFRPDHGDDRFWCIPSEPERRPCFVASLLDLVGDWKSCYVWRHLGSWPNTADSGRVNDIVELQILKGLGLPLGTARVINFSRAEENLLITLLFATTIFAWSTNEDLYIVPDHANHILQTDHHGVIHVSFRRIEEIDSSVLRMSARGFYLPENVPDETFARPKWMKDL